MIQTSSLLYFEMEQREKLGLSETESKVIEFGIGVFLDVCVKIIDCC
ncbi:MAG: hypothetical protein V8R94_05865 [Lachnospiraceae bacterium]